MISFLRRSHPPTLVTLLLLLLLFTLYLPLFDLSSQKVEIAMEIDSRQLFFRKSIIERLAGNACQFICLFGSQKVLGRVEASIGSMKHFSKFCFVEIRGDGVAISQALTEEHPVDSFHGALRFRGRDKSAASIVGDSQERLAEPTTA